jgi:23S rRNA (uracil1939-C5)-methyltransferase
LKVGRSQDGSSSLGFFEAESNRLIAIDACPILSPRLNAVLGELRSEPWARLLANCREVELLADDLDENVMLTLAAYWSAKESESLAQKCLGDLPGIRTAAISQGPDLRVFGEPHLTYRVGECAYQVSPTAFFQSSRFLLSELVTTVVGEETGTVAVDLYAGVGFFTLPMARRFAQIIAVESHPKAAADLAVNARASGGANIRVVAETAFDFLRRCAQAESDLVVMDPPRAGVGVATVTLLMGLRPKRLRYVSCNPPTLARDLGFLIQHGYHLDALEMFDLFPQTYHIESLARLSRVG